MSVYRKPGGQFAYKGHVISLANDLTLQHVAATIDDLDSHSDSR